MKGLYITILTLFLTGFISEILFAQSNRLRYADRQFELANYRQAAVGYANSYASKQEYATARKAGLALDLIYAYAESYTWWKKAISHSEATKEDFAALLRAGYRSVQNYDATKDLLGSSYVLADFEEFSNPDNVTRVSYRVYELKEIDALNSDFSDYGLTDSKSDIQFFASNRGDGSLIKKPLVRFDAKGAKPNRNYFNSDGRSYYGIYSKSADGEVMPLRVEGYDVFHLTDPQLFSNGNMIFTATPNQLNKGDRVIYPGLFYGKLDTDSNTIKEVKAFPYNQTDAFAVISPSVFQEKKILYFSSNRPGGQGGYDLYYVTWDNEMNFSEPINLGLGINSPANERDAFRTGSEFFFSSDRKGGFGGLDIYTARVHESLFGAVSNLGQPINSSSDDFGFVKYTETQAHLASDRVGGKGYDDLYSVSWSDRRLKIMIVDHAGNSLKAGTSLRLIAGNQVNDITDKNEMDILNMVEKGDTYIFSASKPGYFNKEVIATLSKDQEEITIVMAPIPYSLEVYQDIIYYDLDKDFLREQSKMKLNQISEMMHKHPELNLVIESHADSRASDKYNQRLSERRAKSVAKYLEENGISGQRVSAAWFSKSKLINDCGDGVPCPDSKHQLNRRSELRLVAFPDKNKVYDMPSGAKTTDFQNSESALHWFEKK